MKGIVNKFLNDKKFGFIIGEDGNDYFFHITDVDSSIELSSEDFFQGMEVEFDPNLNKKGYYALKIKIVHEDEITNPKYIEKPGFTVSKVGNVKGYETVDMCNFRFEVDEKDPQLAKAKLEKMCRSVGANAMLGFSRQSYTASEAGTGSGTYYYTRHMMMAAPATVAQRSCGIGKTFNEFGGKLKEECMAQFDENDAYVKKMNNRRMVMWIIFWLILIPALLGFNFVLLGGLFIYRFFIPTKREPYISRNDDFGEELTPQEEDDLKTYYDFRGKIEQLKNKNNYQL